MPGPYETGRFAAVPADEVASVHTRDDVVRVVERMLEDLRAHPDEWENATLPRFLDGLVVSLGALDGLYANRDEALPAQPTWRVLAEVLIMASGYE